jgi:hypothetical protein
MIDHYILDEIPEHLVKEYNIDDAGHTKGWGDKIYSRAKRKVTPFTGYEIIELNGKFYVRVPKINTNKELSKDGG